MNRIEGLEQRILRVESVLILLSIGAIAAADRLVAPDASLGFLYLVPLSYSALTHRWPWFLGLLLLCVGLRQWDTPVQGQSWGRLAVDWTLVAAFLGVVLPLRRLGRARSLFFRAARDQRDELVREVEMAAVVQRQLLDQHRPPAGPLDVVARTEPAKVVGGDYYDFVTPARRPPRGRDRGRLGQGPSGRAASCPRSRSRCARWPSATRTAAPCSPSSTGSSSTTCPPPPTSR